VFTFLCEVIYLSNEEIDPKMLKRNPKWFIVDELEAWTNNEPEQTSFSRVVFFYLASIYYFLNHAVCKCNNAVKHQYTNHV